MEKKAFAALQVLALLLGVQAPALHAASSRLASGVPIARLGNIGSAMAGILAPKLQIRALTQQKIQVGADLAVSLPASVVRPRTADFAGGQKAKKDDASLAILGLLSYGPLARQAAGAENLSEARTGSEENFIRSAALGDVGVAAGQSQEGFSSENALEQGQAKPEAAEAPADSPQREILLPNGMRVLLVRKPGAFNVDIAVGYAVGGRDEPKGESGYTHFVEHIMFQGTKTIHNWFRVIGAMGSRVNAFTAKDHTIYTQTVPREFLKLAILLETERMIHLDVTAEKVEREKRVILEEKADRDDSPYASGYDKLAELIFSNPRNRSNVIGSEHDIRSATPENLRRYLDAYYGPERAKVVITGDVDLDQTEAWVRRHLGRVPARASGAAEPDFSEEAQTRERYAEVKDPFAANPALLFGWQGPRYGTPAYYAAGILVQLLCERLREKLVVERQRALDVSLALPYLERDPGAIQGSIKLGSRLTAEEAESALDAEIAALERGEFTQEELAAAIRTYSAAAGSDNAAHLALAAVRGLDIADLLGDIRRWEQVNSAQVRAAARDFLASSKRNIVLIRPDPNPRKERTRRPREAQPRVDETPTPTEEKILNHLAGFKWSGIEARPPAEFQLPNGLKIIVVPDGRVPTVSAKLAFRLGSTASDIEVRKNAPYVAALLSHRTRVTSAAAISDLLKRIQGTLGSEQKFDRVVFNGNAPSGQALALLKLMAEMVAKPHQWTAEEMAPWKDLWKDALRESLSDPAGASQQRAVEDLLGRHPSAQASPTEDALDALTPEEFARLVRIHFAPDNAVLVIAGDVYAQRVRELVSPLFQDWRPSGQSFGQGPAAEVLPQRAISLIDRPGSEQTLIRLSGVGIGAGSQSSPDFFPLIVADQVLGNGFGSRLYQVIRQSLGHAYSPFSSLVTDPIMTLWTFGLSTKPEKTGPALRALLGQAQRMRTEPPSLIELGSAKNAVIGSFWLALDNIASMADHVLGLELFGLPVSEWSLFPDQVARVTAEAVRQVAGKVLDPEHLAITVVGEADAIREDISGVRPVREFGQDGRLKAKVRDWLAALGFGPRSG